MTDFYKKIHVKFVQDKFKMSLNGVSKKSKFQFNVEVSLSWVNITNIKTVKNNRIDNWYNWNVELQTQFLSVRVAVKCCGVWLSETNRIWQRERRGCGDLPIRSITNCKWIICLCWSMFCGYSVAVWIHTKQRQKI